MKHRLAQAALLGAFVLTAAGTDSPRWLRNTSLSPDGSTVAFTYKGNIYTVPSAGGRATRITADGTYNPQPNPAVVSLDVEKAQNWIKNGAQPTDTVRGLLKKAGVL